MILPISFAGINISVMTDLDSIASFKNQLEIKIEFEDIIMILEDNNNIKHYVVALCFGVYHNNLDILESSIGRFDFGNLGELKLWYAV